MKHTRLKRRGAVYYFRCKIPADLVEHYGKREILESLHTKDPKEALRKVRSRSLQQEEEFDRVRAGRGVAELTEELLETLSKKWVAGVLAEDEDNRVGGWMKQQHVFDEDAGSLQQIEAGLRESLARGDFTLVEASADDVLQESGIKLDKGSDSYRRLCFRILKAGIGLVSSLQARNRGDVVDTPKAPNVKLPLAPKAVNGAMLSDLLVRWEKERQPSTKARQEWGVVVRRFTEQNGDLPVDMIERQHVVAFKDRMVDNGASPATIRKHLGALGSLLQLAVDNGLCTTNVGRGVRVRGSKVAAESRLPYDSDDLKSIFSSPIYSEGVRPEAGAGEAAYWLPVLALFTGARLEELGQARVEDVKESDGVRYLDISDIGGGTSVKTVSSRRRVPIHPELARLGFLDYVDERKRAMDERLFPDLRQDRFGKWTQNWSKWWGRYAREQAKISDPRKVFHSFRHTFKHGCRACGIPEDVHDALTGHSSGGGVGRTYGGAYPLKPLGAAMKKLRYPGLHLMDLKSVLTSID